MGYVYILTNPSFRENWIKIGKTSRDVNERLSELDNTSTPLPFEVYATIETEKYAELETQAHNILTALTDKRIRNNREFYNFKPEEALKYIKQLCLTIDDAVINEPDSDNDNATMEEISEARVTHRKKKGPYKVNYVGEFHLNSSNGLAQAKMKVINDKYVVLEGSVIDPNVYSNETSVNNFRNNNIDAIKDNVVISNVEFNRPSSAAEFVLGGASNGKFSWISEENKPLNSYIEYLI